MITSITISFPTTKSVTNESNSEMGKFTIQQAVLPLHHMSKATASLSLLMSALANISGQDEVLAVLTSYVHASDINIKSITKEKKTYSFVVGEYPLGVMVYIHETKKLK